MPALVSARAAARNRPVGMFTGPQYLVKSDGTLYSLTPASSDTGSIAERAALGWSKAFGKSSSLFRQDLGTPLQLGDDGRHFFVKVDSRESKYAAVETR